MAKFISSLGEKSGSRFLDRQSKKEMAYPYGKTEDGDEYGLGLDIGYIDGRKIIGHGGGFHGFTTRSTLDMDNDIGIIVLTNSLRTNASEINLGILDSITRLINDADKYSAKSKIPFSKYEGSYRSSWGDDLILRAGDILLDVSPETNNPLKFAWRLLPDGSRNIFKIKSKNVFGPYDEKCEFKDFRNGKAQTLVAANIPMKRIK
jgi:hypothetical protein